MKKEYSEQLAHNAEYQRSKALARGGPGRKRPNRERNVNFVRDFKSENPCVDCGKFFPFFVMEFDHRNRTEKFKKVSALYNGNHEVLLAEIEKCDLVCANCHKVRTYVQIQDDELWGSWRASHGPKEDYERTSPKGWLSASGPQGSPVLRAEIPDVQL